MREDGSGEYSPSIHTQVYQLNIPALSDQLISDLIERYRFEESSEDFAETEHSDLDLLIVHEERELKEVLASKGKAVMHVLWLCRDKFSNRNTVEKMTFISD